MALLLTLIIRQYAQCFCGALVCRGHTQFTCKAKFLALIADLLTMCLVRRGTHQHNSHAFGFGDEILNDKKEKGLYQKHKGQTIAIYSMLP